MAVGVTAWDELSDTRIIPTVIAREDNLVVLGMKPGYYRVWLRTKGCRGEGFASVLDRHDRRLDVQMRCDGRVILWHVDGSRGLAGTLAHRAVAVSMQPADGHDDPHFGMIAGGAYYFDRIDCEYCVLRVKLRGGGTATIGLDLRTREAFGLFRRDITQQMLSSGSNVRGSPFNAPERLAEGPRKSVWALDRLGNRVALIPNGSRACEYDLPTPYADAGAIVATTKYVWITERRVGKIVRFGPDGSHQEFTLARDGFVPERFLAVAGPDDRVWFTDGSHVGAIDNSGTVAYYPRTGELIVAIATGPDGRIWIAGDDWTSGKNRPFIAVLTSANQWERFPLTIAPNQMLAASNGFWITDLYSALSYVTLDGVQRPVALPVGNVWPNLLNTDSAGDAWLTDRYGNMLIRAKPNGSISAWYPEFGPAGISDIATDRAGSVWIAEPKAHTVEEYDKSWALPPMGVRPKYLLITSTGTLWYSDPDADVVGVIGNRFSRSRCYAFRLSHVKHCTFESAQLVK